ncbi:hypothetical protein [Sphingobium subterraneum]|uniref:Uncharacterized protein n=1 Tax=Sphingobium subterraneum TaxID=627688 RepID=A0A841J2S5_9SPHN|nr:hypothetical protein [Sphingobium subterraneum]MBB6122611.1 hypothetical protein [Sphingobium subterraneum]
MLENLLGSLGDIAGKLGLPADQVESLAASLKDRLAQGGDPVATAMELAREHGLPVDKLQEMLGGSVGTDGLLGKVGDMLGGEGNENPLGNLGDLAKGLFK